jgi:hypothetical protein
MIPPTPWRTTSGETTTTTTTRIGRVPLRRSMCMTLSPSGTSSWYARVGTWQHWQTSPRADRNGNALHGFAIRSALFSLHLHILYSSCRLQWMRLRLSYEISLLLLSLLVRRGVLGVTGGFDVTRKVTRVRCQQGLGSWPHASPFACSSSYTPTLLRPGAPPLVRPPTYQVSQGEQMGLLYVTTRRRRAYRWRVSAGVVSDDEHLFDVVCAYMR